MRYIIKKLKTERGFTLIELMAVLGILALIVLIAVPGISNVMDNAEASAEGSSIEMIEKAGGLAFVGGLAFDEPENEGEEIYRVPTLVEKGYLDLAEDNPLNVDANYVLKEKNDTFTFVGPPEPTDPTLFNWAFVSGDSGSIKITGYTGSETDIVIPGEIEGHTVTEIGDKAFYRNINRGLLTSVYLPSSVTAIGIEAFYNNDIETLHLPNNLETIASKAFYLNSLSTVRISSAVVTIGSEAFKANPSITGWMTIEGYSGSEAERYAISESFTTFKALD